MRWAIPVLLAVAIAPAYSQEGLASVSLDKSDVIVVGTLYQDFNFNVGIDHQGSTGS